MKYFALFLFISFCLQTGAQTVSPEIDSIIQLITPSTYQQHFDSLPVQPTSFRKVTESSIQSPDHDACRDYIFRRLKIYLGEENVYLQSFDEGNNQGLANVIGIKKGRNPEKGIIVVSAHYDSNNSRVEDETDCSPGANDNGTGISAIIEIARVLSNINTECSILFTAWDLEEQYTNGYPSGSNRWFTDYTYKARKSKRNNKRNEGKIARSEFIATINFDMFGNPRDTIEGKPVLWACSGRLSHYKFVDEYISTLERYVPSIKAINKGLLIYSDHYTFASRKIPSVENLESEYDSDPFYHTCSDNIENPKNIDYSFATNVTRGGLAFLLEKAGLAK